MDLQGILWNILRKKKNLFKIIYREIFDRKSDSGFTQHTKIEHYMWNYIFYIGYLKDKDPNEYGGIESFIV